MFLFHSLFFPFLRILQFCLKVIFFSVLIISCSSDDVYINIHRGGELDFFKRDLISFQKNNVSVDTVKNVDGAFDFCFSNKSSIIVADTAVHCIDIRDGERPYDYYQQGAIEDYENWSFFFSDGSSACIKKTLFLVNPDERIRGINHRGHSVDAPENTLPAFRLSKLKGFRFVEADVSFTKDNIPVLLHDSTIDRTSNGSGLVRELLWDELIQYDYGEWKSNFYYGTKIPSLYDFLDLCGNLDLWPYLELKSGNREQIKIIVELVEEYGLKGKVVYISFLAPLLHYVVDNDSEASIGFLTGTPLTSQAIDIARGLKTENNYVFIDSSDTSDTAVSLCEEASIPLELWTIESEAMILSLSPYITGVTSNSLHAGRVRGNK